MKFREIWKKEDGNKNPTSNPEKCFSHNISHNTKINRHAANTANLSEDKMEQKQEKRKVLILFESMNTAHILKEKLNTVADASVSSIWEAQGLIENNRIDLVISEIYDLDVLEPLVIKAKEKGTKVVIMTGLRSSTVYWAEKCDKVLHYNIGDENINEIKKLLTDQGQEENQ